MAAIAMSNNLSHSSFCTACNCQKGFESCRAHHGLCQCQHRTWHSCPRAKYQLFRYLELLLCVLRKQELQHCLEQRFLSLFLSLFFCFELLAGFLKSQTLELLVFLGCNELGIEFADGLLQFEKLPVVEDIVRSPDFKVALRILFEAFELLGLDPAGLRVLQVERCIIYGMRCSMLKYSGIRSRVEGFGVSSQI